MYVHVPRSIGSSFEWMGAPTLRCLTCLGKFGPVHSELRCATCLLVCRIQGALLSEHILSEDLPLVVSGIRQAKPSLEKHLQILERTRKTSSSGGRGKRKYWTGVIFHEEEGLGDP